VNGRRLSIGAAKREKRYQWGKRRQLIIIELGRNENVQKMNTTWMWFYAKKHLLPPPNYKAALISHWRFINPFRNSGGGGKKSFFGDAFLFLAAAQFSAKLPLPQLWRAHPVSAARLTDGK
jgi:hypothetical protein